MLTQQTVAQVGCRYAWTPLFPPCTLTPTRSNMIMCCCNSCCPAVLLFLFCFCCHSLQEPCGATAQARVPTSPARLASSSTKLHKSATGPPTSSAALLHPHQQAPALPLSHHPHPSHPAAQAPRPRQARAPALPRRPAPAPALPPRQAPAPALPPRPAPAPALHHQSPPHLLLLCCPQALALRWCPPVPAPPLLLAVGPSPLALLCQSTTRHGQHHGWPVEQTWTLQNCQGAHGETLRVLQQGHPSLCALTIPSCTPM